MAFHLNPNSLAFNLNSPSLPGSSHPPSPPRFSHGVEISASPLSVSGQADRSSSLTPCSPRGQLFSSDQLSQTIIRHGFCEGSTSVFPQHPATSATQPPRGKSSSRAFLEVGAKYPVHVAGPAEVARRPADLVALTGYPGSGIPDTSQASSQNAGFQNPKMGFRVSASGPVGPILPAGFTANLCEGNTSTLRQLPANPGTGKGKSPVILLPSSPPPSLGDAIKFFQVAQLDTVHVAAPRVEATRAVGPSVAGPSRSAFPLFAGPVSNQATNGFFDGPVGPIHQGPVIPSVNANSVVVNILSALSRRQIEQEEMINNVSDENVNLSRDLILLKHQSHQRINNFDTAAWNELNAVNWRAQALGAKHDETEQIFSLVIAERDEKFNKIETDLNLLKKEREKEKAKEAEKKEKSRKFWNYTLIGVGGALLVGFGVGAAVFGCKK